MRRISARTAVAFFAAALTCGALAAPSGAANRSLPRVRGTAPQPGPAALYEPLAKAPQLENAPRSGWTAKPILISGASAYGKGEYLYQGFIYDDRGAKEATDPSNPMHSPGGDASGGDLFSAPDGTYDYPSGPGYDENAADRVELRLQPRHKPSPAVAAKCPPRPRSTTSPSAPTSMSRCRGPRAAKRPPTRPGGARRHSQKRWPRATSAPSTPTSNFPSSAPKPPMNRVCLKA